MTDYTGTWGVPTLKNLSADDLPDVPDEVMLQRYGFVTKVACLHTRCGCVKLVNVECKGKTPPPVIGVPLEDTPHLSLSAFFVDEREVIRQSHERIFARTNHYDDSKAYDKRLIHYEEAFDVRPENRQRIVEALERGVRQISFED